MTIPTQTIRDGTGKTLPTLTPLVLQGLLIVAPLLLPFNPGGAHAGEPPALRFASINVEEIAGGALKAKPPPPKPSWRTTFGSERRSEPKTDVGPETFDADVVLLQGVTAVRILRRLFPARHWRLIVSRQVLTTDDPLAPWSRDAVAPVPTTAVAVRYQEGLRVTGQDHLMALASPAADGLAEPRPAAGTAVRLQRSGTTLWALSVHLTPRSCDPDEPDCREPKALAEWRRERASEGEAVVTGGRLATQEPSALPPPPCPQQAISVAGITASAETPMLSPGSSEERLGCVARLALPAGN